MQKEKGKKDKQRSTKHAHKTKDRVTRTPVETWVNSGAPEGYAVLAPLVAPVVLNFFLSRIYPKYCSLDVKNQSIKKLLIIAKLTLLFLTRVPTIIHVRKHIIIKGRSYKMKIMKSRNFDI